MIAKTSIPSHSQSVVSKRVGDEYLLVPLTDNIADMNALYRLNATGAFIWESIDGTRSVADIIGLLVDEFDAEAGEAERDTLLFLERIKEFVNFNDQ